MDNDNISIQDRSELFAIRAIKAYTELNKRHFDNVGKVLENNFSGRVLVLVQTLPKMNLHSQKLTLDQVFYSLKRGQ